MTTTRVIDPVTRLEGHLKVEIQIENSRVVNAQATGTLFRGFEAILANRDPLDGPDITQRICGVCPVSHGTAAALALERAARLTVPENARIMRNLVLGSNFVQSHILHFYHLALMDFADGPAMPPWQPSWSADKRFDASSPLIAHYVGALDMRRKAHEMGALFGGRLPHPPSFVPGGFTTTPRAERITRFKAYLAELTSFIKDIYIPDVFLVAQTYGEYYGIGRGYGNLISYGVFDLDAAGVQKLLKRGVVRAGGPPQPLDVNAITEQVTYSWYADKTNNLKPASGVTTPDYPKNGQAYSWLKAPRYQNAPHEAGALARMTVSGFYNHGVSVMDRHIARAWETQRVAEAMGQWVNQLSPSGAVYQQFTTPNSATGIGLTEAPRGALGHWVRLTRGRIGNYQVITPTCWNASPRDTAGAMGPIEAALIGTPVSNPDEPVEVVRVIHSFDPCLSCAVHVMRPSGRARIFSLGHFHGEEEGDHGHAHSH